MGGYANNLLLAFSHAQAAPRACKEKRQFKPAHISTPVLLKRSYALVTGAREPWAKQTSVYRSHDKSHRMEADPEILQTGGFQVFKP